jgi:hypothetical protein
MKEQESELRKVSENFCTFLSLHTTTTSEIQSKIIKLNRNIDNSNLKIELALTRLSNIEKNLFTTKEINQKQETDSRLNIMQTDL